MEDSSNSSLLNSEWKRAMPSGEKYRRRSTSSLSSYPEHDESGQEREEYGKLPKARSRPKTLFSIGFEREIQDYGALPISEPKQEERTTERQSEEKEKQEDESQQSSSSQRYGVPVNLKHKSLETASVTTFNQTLHEMRKKSKNPWAIDFEELQNLEEFMKTDTTNILKGKWREQDIIFKQYIQNESKDSSTFMKEVKVVSKMRPSKNVLKPFGFCIDPDFPLGIVSENLKLGDLKNHLLNNSISLKESVSLAIDIARGLKHLHYDFIVHRNLNASNILLDTNKDGLVALVSGFTLSRVWKEEEKKNQRKVTNTTGGHVKWLPPESLTKRIYSFKTDIWMYGCTLTEIFTSGKDPLDDIPDPIDASLKIVKKERIPVAKDVNPSIVALQEKIFAYNPDDRPSLDEIIKELQDISSELM